MARANARFGRYLWRLLLPLIAIELIAFAVWQKRISDSARGHLDEGRAALERDDPSEARRHFELSLASRPKSGEANFLAARAARRGGDPNAAKTFLKRAESLGQPAADIGVERALINAQSGSIAEAEATLVAHLKAGGTESEEIIELLLPVYMAEYRVVEADELTAKWVALRPVSAKAWRHRAEILERVPRRAEAAIAWRQLVVLAPDDRPARLNLARMLIETKQPPDEAARHLEWLTALEPDHAAALIQLAQCREAQGRPDDAAALLDRVIAGPACDAKALHVRGRLELNRGRAADALAFLRRALELDPTDVELLYTHFLSLQQTGTPAEISAAEERWKRCETDLRRVGALAWMIASSPRDPELRREIGELFLKNGKTTEGLRWLNSALRLDPQHAPTHRVLASHYERTGQGELAHHHKSLISGTSPETPGK